MTPFVMTLSLLAGCEPTGNPDITNHASLQAEADAKVEEVCPNGNPPRTYFIDKDGDGSGGRKVTSCKRPTSGWARKGGDCDDTDPAINPGATEVGDRVDNNCDGTADEDLGVVISNDGSGGVTAPAGLWAWFGASNSAYEFVETYSEYLVFDPSEAEIADHPWVDMQASWNQTSETTWNDWSTGCTGFAVSSADHMVQLYQNTDGSDDHCRVYLDGSSPSGSDLGVWALVVSELPH